MSCGDSARGPAGERLIRRWDHEHVLEAVQERLARSLRQLIETVEALEERKIGFRSLTEAIDTTTSGGRLVFHIFAALAEFERSIIRERTLAGLAAAKDRGAKPGRKPALDADDVAAARALLMKGGLTVEEVARRLNVSPSTLYRYLPAARAIVTRGEPAE